MRTTIDLNADVGEVEGESNVDAALMHWISSCNIACGAHAGDPQRMRDTVRLALRNNVAIGAHPGYADRESMGRREQAWTPEGLRALIHDQLVRLDTLCREEGARMVHVKPHGALYNQAARDPAMAGIIAATVAAHDPDLVLVGLANSALTQAGLEAGLRVAHEVFADRRYEDDGTLTPRTHPQAVIADEKDSLYQVICLAEEGRVRSRTGQWLALPADTLCLHGDGAHAVAFARAARGALAQRGIGVRGMTTRNPQHHDERTS